MPGLRRAAAARRSAPLRLDRIEARHVRLPLRHPFETSFGRTTVKEFLLVSVTAGGVTGHGECVADTDPFYLPETLGTVRHVLREFLAPLAFAAELRHPRELAPALARVRGHEMAKAGLEMAVWELFARRDGVPLYRLLGGRGGEVAAGVSVGLQKDAGALVDEVAGEVAAGYRRIKIKIKPGQDLSLVEAVRARFPEVPLMADANAAYTLADIPLFRALDAHALTMVEQPLGWDDIVDHATLQRQIRTPVCLDESIRSPADARKALDLGACRVVNIKAGRVGGFAASLAIHDLCRARDAPVWCGGMLESGIGRLANVHLQTLPGFTLPGDTSASARYFAEDLVDPPVTVSPGGFIAVPEGPGIGHRIVWERVEKATLAREEWRRD
ncbi:MAG TPA: o-succinylbenzoate synthase [Vicinamibacteria bacterium]|nr:o-succinylbenzoate synthase [Vicinamibacteria bacterium]